MHTQRTPRRAPWERDLQFEAVCPAAGRHWLPPRGACSDRDLVNRSAMGEPLWAAVPLWRATKFRPAVSLLSSLLSTHSIAPSNEHLYSASLQVETSTSLKPNLCWQKHLRVQPSPIEEVQPVPSCLKKKQKKHLNRCRDRCKFPYKMMTGVGELNERNCADADSEPAHLGSGSCKVSTLPDWCQKILCHRFVWPLRHGTLWHR